MERTDFLLRKTKTYNYEKESGRRCEKADSFSELRLKRSCYFKERKKSAKTTGFM